MNDRVVTANQNNYDSESKRSDFETAAAEKNDDSWLLDQRVWLVILMTDIASVQL